MTAVADQIQIDEAAFRGDVVRPGTPDYEVNRKIWNGSFDKHPALIIRCAGVSDVIAAVKFGQESGLPVAVRSGGHSFPGHSVADGALMMDLRPMKGVRVDPEKMTARVQAGVLLGELDKETQAFGLAVPSGIVTHTGVAGLTLGGGIGWIQRKHGLSVDKLISMDVVTADGEFVKASADENPDLFWGLRGGGGNFGIVTEFEFECVPLGTHLLAGPIFWPMEQSGEVLRFYRDWVADAPDELMTIVVHRKAPPLPFVPAELHGKPIVMVIVCWAGDPEEGEKFIKPLREFGNPVADVCMVKPYLTHQAMLDPSFPHGRWYYFKSCDVAELTDEIIDITVERSLQIKSPLTSFPIWQMGGAISKVADDETPFGGRQAAFTYNIGCCTETEEGFPEERDWARSFWSALEPWHQWVYVNFLENESEERVRTAYGAEKYDRLKSLKRKYDPENFFRLNQNIPPN
jgi:FAD/FMN-containing dehydrogenase